MTQVSRHYSLRRFARSSDPNYLTALSIYVDNVPAASRTNSNEITYWLDRSYAEFGDDFIVCGFFIGQKVVGYAQLTLLRKERLLFFDYIVLHPAYRSLGEYFQFAILIRQWIETERFEFDYIVGEVSFESPDSVPSRNCIRLVRLFKQMGFGVAQCEYYYPPLGHHQTDTGQRAHLVVWSHTRVKVLTREMLLHIIRSVYFQHYLRWFTPFTANTDHYDAIIRILYGTFEKTLSGQKYIVVNGIKLVLPPVALSEAQNSQSASLLKPLIIIAVFGLFCGTFIYLQARVRIRSEEIVILFSSTLLVFATAFALCSKESRTVLFALLRTISKFLGKSK